MSRQRRTTTDRNDLPVTVGARVRVLGIAALLERDLEADEWARLSTMRGEVFEVYEIDDRGGAWIMKDFAGSVDETCGYIHSLALDPAEMELVAPARRRFRLRMRR